MVCSIFSDSLYAGITINNEDIMELLLSSLFIVIPAYNEDIMELLLSLYILVGIFYLSNKLLLLYRTEPETGNGYNGGLFVEISSENECSVL